MSSVGIAGGRSAFSWCVKRSVVTFVRKHALSSLATESNENHIKRAFIDSRPGVFNAKMTEEALYVFSICVIC